MFRAIPPKIFGLICMMALLCISALPAAAQAEDSTSTPTPPPTPSIVVKPAPLPVQIQAAKRVFISNAGGELEDWYAKFLFSGGPNRFYDEFYADMKDWGHYELVSAPADADLIFEIHAGDIYLGEREGVPRFELTIYDPKTRVVLWALAEHLDPALRKGNRDKNFDKGINKLMDQVKQLAGPAATALTSQSKQPSPEPSTP
jgi:hypothetical protein